MARTLAVWGLALIACDGPIADLRDGELACEGAACTCDDSAPGEWIGDLEPLDGSSAWGTVRIRTGIYGATLTIEADGLEPDVAHPQQLRGAEDGSPVGCEGDARGDVLEHLGPFPVADASGSIDYEAHWDGAGVCPVDARVVVVTGAFVADEWDPRAPVLCGVLSRAGPSTR